MYSGLCTVKAKNGYKNIVSTFSFSVVQQKQRLRGSSLKASLEFPLRARTSFRDVYFFLIILPCDNRWLYYLPWLSGKVIFSHLHFYDSILVLNNLMIFKNKHRRINEFKNLTNFWSTNNLGQNYLRQTQLAHIFINFSAWKYRHESQECYPSHVPFPHSRLFGRSDDSWGVFDGKVKLINREKGWENCPSKWFSRSKFSLIPKYPQQVCALLKLLKWS